MKPVRILRPIVKQFVPQRVLDQVRRMVRATPAASLYTLASDENGWIHDELSLLSNDPWSEPRNRKSTAGMSERVVEIPWVLSRYHGERRVLDVGTAWARAAYKQKLTGMGIPELHGVDLAAERVAGVRMTRADVRQMPYRECSFDLVICVSTLEHIGLDNSVYGTPGELREGGDVAAMNEFRRVLVPGGRLLITVPFGRRHRLDWLQQYDESHWESLLDQSKFSANETSIYAYSDVLGWRQSSPGNHPHKGFQEGGAPAATGVLCADLKKAGP